MSEPARVLRNSFRDYVALEEYSNVKHEFVGGLILAMAGGTPEHAALAAAVIGHLFRQLDGGPCRTYDSDLRVRVAATGLATYPDVSVVCGPRQSDSDDPNTVLNPIVLVEVTSPSSDEYDRGEKREHYEQIVSLREYVVVSHREAKIDVWRRGAGSEWSRFEFRAGAIARLDSLGVELDVAAVYRSAQEPRA